MDIAMKSLIITLLCVFAYQTVMMLWEKWQDWRRDESSEED